jgi:hypothetical protein
MCTHISECAARQDLTKECHTSNLRSSKLNASEAVQVRGASASLLDLHLNIHCVHKLSQLALKLLIGLVAVEA